MPMPEWLFGHLRYISYQKSISFKDSFEIVRVDIPINIEEFLTSNECKEKVFVFWFVVKRYFIKADISAGIWHCLNTCIGRYRFFVWLMCHKCFYFDSVENANAWVVLYWQSKIWASAIKNSYWSNTTFKIVMVGIPINVEEFWHLVGVKEKNWVFWLVVHCYFTKADIQQFVNIGISKYVFCLAATS